MSQLEQLRQYTTVVADTGHFLDVRQYQPRDVTTNPTLILKAAQDPAYADLLAPAREHAQRAALEEAVDALLVRFGCALAAIVPGRVSTEVDARLSFDTAATIARARGLIARYAEAGVGPERVLIKIAATWEGIQAARVLQAEGIRCNLTLVFALEQAVACAAAGVTLISPFVGRILDWHKRQAGSAWVDAQHTGERDPGVQSVTRIHRLFKGHGIATEIMGASFRNIDQIRALAGCDLLTIAPALLAELQASQTPLPRRLQAQGSPAEPWPVLDEATFRYRLNADAMATEKLAEGIRLFAADGARLDDLLRAPQP